MQLDSVLDIRISIVFHHLLGFKLSVQLVEVLFDLCTTRQVLLGHVVVDHSLVIEPTRDGVLISVCEFSDHIEQKLLL